MGTRSKFPTTFWVSSHPLLYSFSTLIIFFQSLEFFFLANLIANCTFSTLPPFTVFPRLFVNILTCTTCKTTDLSAAPLDPSSFHSLDSILLSQLNCHPHLHHRVQALYLSSVSCFSAVRLSLLSTWISFIMSLWDGSGSLSTHPYTHLIWHMCDPLDPCQNLWPFFFLLFLAALKWVPATRASWGLDWCVMKWFCF